MYVRNKVKNQQLYIDGQPKDSCFIDRKRLSFTRRAVEHNPIVFAFCNLQCNSFFFPHNQSILLSFSLMGGSVTPRI